MHCLNVWSYYSWNKRKSLVVQARLQQAEHLLRQQRALLDHYSQDSRNSKLTSTAIGLHPSENEYWRSRQLSSQGPAAGPVDEARPLQDVSLSTAARYNSDEGPIGMYDCQLLFPAVQSREQSGHNSSCTSRASSVVGLGGKKVANRKAQRFVGTASADYRSEGYICNSQLGSESVQSELDCRWC